MGVKTIVITVLIIVAAFVCLELFIPAPFIECDFADTVNITAGHRFPNGSYKFNNIIYDEGFYKNYDFVIDKKRVKKTVGKHIRGCLCAIKSCIRTCKTYDDHHHVKVFDEDETEQKIHLKNNTDYHILTHRPCQNMFFLDEDTDKWIFYKNGSIKVGAEELLHSRHICFSNETKADNKTIVMVCVDRTDVEDGDKDEMNLNKTKLLLNLIGMSISVIFLLMTFLIYGWIPEMRNVHGRSLMSYVGSLMFLFIFLIFVHLDDSMYSSSLNCKLTGYGVYFFVILCFFWLNVMCYETWSTFRGTSRVFGNVAEHKRFAVYFTYAFGSTTLLTLILLFVDEVLDVSDNFKPSIGNERCWVQANRLVEFLYIYLPISLISLVNIILYLITAYKIYMCQNEMVRLRIENDQSNSSIHADKDRFYLHLQLFIIMGVSWTMEIVSWAFENSLYIFILTDVINSLQGIIIFFLFIWTPKVIGHIKKRWNSSSLNCCSNSKAELSGHSIYPEVTTKTSSNDSKLRGKFIIDDL